MCGDEPSPPPTPDYAAASREGVQADIDTLPQRLKIQQQAQLGLGEFEGLGQEAQLDQLLNLYAKSAPQLAQQQLDLNAQFDPQRIAQARSSLQQSDPTSFALHEQFNTDALNNLKLGDSLSADQIRNSQQATRQAQTARGNYYGDNASVEEALGQTGLGLQMQQQRFGNAAQALGLGASNNQFSSLQAAQNGATANNAIAPNLPFGVNPNAGAQGAQFAQQNYQGQMQAYQLAQNSSNPWLQGLGTIAGLGSSLGSAALLAPACWVAREVFGIDNPKWLQFRDYIFKQGGWFLEYYLERGQGMALFLEANPEHKEEVRIYMEGCLNG